jgi:two-component system chemotaxis response regulator CheB
MSPIRTLVIEDSVTIRRHLVEVLTAHPDFEVIGEAEDGKRAIELCQQLRPDVITLDIVLPVMSGLAVAEYVMAYCPTPILVVSSSTNRGELMHTYDALAAGAVDVLEKPDGSEAAGVWERRFAGALRTASRIPVVTHPRGRLGALGRLDPPLAARATAAERYALLALGASTGGPGAVRDVLRALPTPFPLPILVVLHLGHPFGTLLAEWLDGLGPHRVALARDGQRLLDLEGRVAVAPPDQHLQVSRGRLRLTSDPERHSCRPSVDVLFDSIADEEGQTAIACLLTGMGKDGAAGLLRIRRAGGFTVAQDEASSVVYGMPREAAALGAARRICALEEVGPLVGRLARLDREAVP